MKKKKKKKTLICMQCSFTLRGVYLSSQSSYYSPALENNMEKFCCVLTFLCTRLLREKIKVWLIVADFYSVFFPSLDSCQQSDSKQRGKGWRWRQRCEHFRLTEWKHTCTLDSWLTTFQAQMVFFCGCQSCRYDLHTFGTQNMQTIHGRVLPLRG